LKRKLTRIPLALLGLAMLYLLFWPVPIDPAAWTPPSAPPLAGIYAVNNRLAAIERLAQGAAVGPEDIAVDAQGRIYGGYVDGRILRFPLQGGAPEVFARTGGRPAGLRFDSASNLICADTEKGLLSIAPDGSVTTLATEQGGALFGITDDLDIAADGTIYFSDASSKFRLKDLLFEVIEHRPNGRLLSYDPATKSTRLILSGLYFANGVALGPDQSFVLVAETTKYRVRRVWLSGPKKGQSEVFIDNLPGLPDGILWNGRDAYWLTLFAPRDAMLDTTLPHPFLRKVMARILPLLPTTPKRHAFVLSLDAEGRVIHNLQDASPSAYAPITNAVEHEGMLYFGSTEQDSIGRLKFR
jgi:sugar lactone lactonase YvrE